MPTLSMYNGATPLVFNFLDNGIGDPSVQIKGISLIDSYWLMIVGGLNFIVIGIYLELVMPKDYGRRRHPLFFILCFFTCCTKKAAPENENENLALSQFSETKYLAAENYESVQPEFAAQEKENRILRVADLRKTFENGFKAVQGVSMKMYSD